MENVRGVVYFFALVVFLFLENVRPFFAYQDKRFRHALLNISFGLINGVLGVFLIKSWFVDLLSLEAFSEFGLLQFVSSAEWLQFSLSFLFFDFWMYVWHRLNHRLSFLWRFHQIHHSDSEMDVTTGIRFHPVEILLSWLIRVPLVILLGMNFTQLLFYEMIMQTIVFFHHSNFALPEKVDRLLRRVIVTPNMHRVHHSIKKIETDSNYGSVFSFWDRFLGTYRVACFAQIQLGLNSFREKVSRDFRYLLWRPFREEGA